MVDLNSKISFSGYLFVVRTAFELGIDALTVGELAAVMTNWFTDHGI
jgi:hypothetical protein